MPATCEKTGVREYYSCDGCERVFSDIEGQHEITTSLVTPALGHSWGEASCTYEEYVTPLFRLVGVIGERECTVCHKHDENGILLNGYEEIKSPTCKETGTARYYFDPDNYDPDALVSPDFTWFIKENGQFRDFEYEMTLPESDDHNWGSVTYKWSDDCSLASAERKCSVCGKFESENVTTTSEITKQPTCEEMGEHTYKAHFASSAFADQTKTVADIMPTGHDWGDAAYAWNDDHTQVTATRVCKADSSHIETETMNATGELLSEATCESKEVTRYTSAAFENPYFEAQIIDVETAPAIGHVWSSEIWQEHSVIEGHGIASFFRFCENDSSHYQVLFCEAEKEVIKEPSFTETGEYQYNANFADYAAAHADWVAEEGLDYSWAVDFSWTEEVPALVPVVSLPREMVVTNDAEINDDGTVDYGTVIEFTVKEGFTAQNVKANSSELAATEGVYTITATENITVTADITPAGRVYFTGHSFSLKGNIGVNFYVDLTDEEVQNGAAVDFLWTVDGNEKTYSVTLTADDKTSHGYRASVPVAVAEMTHAVSATLLLGGAEAADDSYSVVQYADVILNDTDFAEAYKKAENDKGNNGAEKLTKLQDLVKSMLDYGSRAQVRFDRNKNNLANGGIYFFKDEPVIESAASTMSANLESFGLRYEYTSVVFLSKTSLRHYYTVVNKGKFAQYSDSVFIGDAKVAPKDKNGMVYFEKSDIAAKELDTQFTLTIGDNTYNYSVMDYVKLLIASDLGEASVELGKATFRYNQKAKAFFTD